jgi:monoamine oxidase
MLPQVAFIYDKPFWKEKGLSGTAFSRGGPMAQIWDASSEEGTSRKRYALSSFVFDDDLKYLEGGDESEAHIRDSPIMKELIEIFGKEAANPTRIVWKSWQIDPYTSVEAKQPNQLSSYQREVPFGHPLVPQSEKGIIFSGTETALNENGHMNGAVLAGIRAADEATKYLARGSK